MAGAPKGGRPNSTIAPYDVGDQSWGRWRACKGVDPEIFTLIGEHADDDKLTEDNIEALALCNQPCPVKQRCYDQAVAQGQTCVIQGGHAFWRRSATGVKAAATLAAKKAAKPPKLSIEAAEAAA